MESEEVVRKALQDVVHLSLSVQNEGEELGEYYHAGPYYPLFVLTDSNGDVIYRWEGYTTAGRFIGSLKTGLTDLVTIEQRIQRNKNNPNNRDINFLAKYLTDIGEYMESNKYYRMAQNKSGRTTRDYSFSIFQNYADAIWNSKLPFDSVFISADNVVNNKKTIKDSIRKLAMMMANLARRKDRTNDIGKYLQAGIDVTASSKNAKTKEYHYLIKADYELYVTHDTLNAIKQKQISMGDGWQNDPAKYYSYGKYCFDRRINLAEAEKYVQMACQKATEGSFRAKHLNLLAEICHARGNTTEAIVQIKLAIENDPDNESYSKQLERFEE